jgi:hypothetical protein
MRIGTPAAKRSIRKRVRELRAGFPMYRIPRKVKVT